MKKNQHTLSLILILFATGTAALPMIAALNTFSTSSDLLADQKEMPTSPTVPDTDTKSGEQKNTIAQISQITSNPLPPRPIFSDPDLDREKQMESEILNMKIAKSKLPRFSETSLILHENNIDPFPHPAEEVKKEQGIHLTDATCTTGRTEYLSSETFDCTSALRSSKKQVNFYTGRGNNYATMTASIPLQDLKEPSIALIQEQEFPTQHASIFYFDDQKEQWKGLCHNLQKSKQECSLQGIVEGIDSLRVRVEGYSPEGFARWSIKSLYIRDASPSKSVSSYQPKKIVRPDSKRSSSKDNDASLSSSMRDALNTRGKNTMVKSTTPAGVGAKLI